MTGPDSRIATVPRDRQRTLADVAFANLRSAGYSTWRAHLKAAQALATVGKLAMAAHAGAGANGWPTQVEYAEHWDVSERTAQREWHLFGQAFAVEPERVDAELERMARWVLSEYAGRLADRASELGSLPADLIAA